MSYHVITATKRGCWLVGCIRIILFLNKKKNLWQRKKVIYLFIIILTVYEYIVDKLWYFKKQIIIWYLCNFIDFVFFLLWKFHWFCRKIQNWCFLRIVDKIQTKIRTIWQGISFHEIKQIIYQCHFISNIFHLRQIQKQLNFGDDNNNNNKMRKLLVETQDRKNISDLQ